ncbi:hypothetical protein Aple_059480 [Acrocarpospora pleiomorpha]|uniref:Uncharacterized protein n=1 Tax=Acrocarpospora pleiomorpha TaxID=90975 RepID=A0A5M3XSU0_9ACTN|nr:hypothetical protein Aple_059480 [Acrocarpospora pleiomorpha]
MDPLSPVTEVSGAVIASAYVVKFSASSSATGLDKDLSFSDHAVGYTEAENGARASPTTRATSATISATATFADPSAIPAFGRINSCTPQYYNQILLSMRL